VTSDERDADSSAGLSTPVPWHVVDVRPAGVFEQLRDPAMFARVGVTHGAVTWPNGVDLAPDAMYDEIKAESRWVP